MKHSPLPILLAGAVFLPLAPFTGKIHAQCNCQPGPGQTGVGTWIIDHEGPAEPVALVLTPTSGTPLTWTIQPNRRNFIRLHGRNAVFPLNRNFSLEMLPVGNAALAGHLLVVNPGGAPIERLNPSDPSTGPGVKVPELLLTPAAADNPAHFRFPSARLDIPGNGSLHLTSPGADAQNGYTIAGPEGHFVFGGTGQGTVAFNPLQNASPWLPLAWSVTTGSGNMQTASITGGSRYWVGDHAADVTAAGNVLTIRFWAAGVFSAAASSQAPNTAPVRTITVQPAAAASITLPAGTAEAPAVSFAAAEGFQVTDAPAGKAPVTKQFYYRNSASGSIGRRLTATPVSAVNAAGTAVSQTVLKYTFSHPVGVTTSYRRNSKMLTCQEPGAPLGAGATEVVEEFEFLNEAAQTGLISSTTISYLHLDNSGWREPTEERRRTSTAAGAPEIVTSSQYYPAADGGNLKFSSSNEGVGSFTLTMPTAIPPVPTLPGKTAPRRRSRSWMIQLPRASPLLQPPAGPRLTLTRLGANQGGP